jgi:hypothetical protein
MRKAYWLSHPAVYIKNKVEKRFYLEIIIVVKSSTTFIKVKVFKLIIY